MTVQVLLPATFDRKAFDTEIRSWSDEQAAEFASQHRNVFAGCFSLDGAPKPTPKPKPTTPPIDKAALATTVLADVTAHPKQRSEDIADRVGHDPRAVRSALEALVDDGKLYADGARRGRRYWVVKANGAAEASA